MDVCIIRYVRQCTGISYADGCRYYAMGFVVDVTRGVGDGGWVFVVDVTRGYPSWKATLPSVGSMQIVSSQLH